jgi:hypothetical protein
MGTNQKKKKNRTHLFCLGQFAADSVEVYDALCGVGVAQDFGVELAESVGFAFGELVPRGQNSDLVEELVVRFSIPLSICQVNCQPELHAQGRNQHSWTMEAPI